MRKLVTYLNKHVTNTTKYTDSNWSITFYGNIRYYNINAYIMVKKTSEGI